MRSYVTFTVISLLGALSTSVSWAEDVFVKYRGPVSLNHFACTATESSVVNRICYRANRQYLIVLLGGTYYHYCRLPASVASQWFGTDSKGKYYNALIKGRYDCREGGIPAD